MTISWSVSATAQQIKQVRSNGDLIITWQGVDYLAMPPDRVRKVNSDLDDLDRLRQAMPLAQQDIKQLHDALDTAQKQRDSADAVSKMAQSVAANWKAVSDQQSAISGNLRTMLDDEHQLRMDAEKFIYKPGKVTKFFNSPWLQIGTKLAIPAWQMARCR